MKPIQFLMNERAPVRRALRLLIRTLGLGSFRFRYAIGALHRMHYAYIIYEAARLAAKLGQDRISVIEFGVAGGNGLLWMEKHAEAIERIFPVRIEIYGFDTGHGLPAPTDYRDLPYHWKAGFYDMDEPALRAKLHRAKLVLGDVAESIDTFRERHSIAPVGAISVDTDFYSSATHAFKIFDFSESSLMPRIFCYMDDTIGSELELYSDFTGERLAITEFNDSHENRKIAVPYYMRINDALQVWPHHIWIAHIFDHSRFNEFVSEDNQQHPLKPIR